MLDVTNDTGSRPKKNELALIKVNSYLNYREKQSLCPNHSAVLKLL